MGDKTIAGGNGRRVQVRSVPERGWTKSKREAFLDHLAQTCNVSASAGAVGLTKTGAYRLRRRDPQFAALWRVALLAGYDRLEELLLVHAGAGVNEIEPGNTEVAAQPFDPRLAMDLLRQHRGTVTNGRHKRLGGQVQRATREEAEARLIRKLEALEKRLRAEAAEA